jgi:hypothetical protein
VSLVSKRTGHPAQARAPYPASTVLIMLDINSRWPTHVGCQRTMVRGDGGVEVQRLSCAGC